MAGRVLVTHVDVLDGLARVSAVATACDYKVEVDDGHLGGVEHGDRHDKEGALQGRNAGLEFRLKGCGIED